MGKYTDDEIRAMKKITVKIAADYLGISHTMVTLGMRNNLLPIGFATKDTVLDQLYQAYQESHESDPPEICNGFKDLAELLKNLPLRDNDAVFNLCCGLCTAYEHKAFLDGLQYGAHLMAELF